MLLDDLRLSIPITRVVSGCASGADSEGVRWALRSAIPIKQFPAKWTTHGKAAGPMRNSEMSNYAEACIAFPGGSGTEDMVRKAIAKGLKVYRVDSRADTKPFNPLDHEQTK